MVAPETLIDMRFLPIRERAVRHSEDMGIRVTHVQLKRIYKKFGVRFRQPKVSIRLPDAREEQLIPERIIFAERLGRLIRARRNIVYADEATF